MVIDHRANPKAPTGQFELVYKQSLSNAPSYLGVELFLTGTQIVPKHGARRILRTTQTTPTTACLKPIVNGLQRRTSCPKEPFALVQSAAAAAAAAGDERTLPPIALATTITKRSATYVINSPRRAQGPPGPAAAGAFRRPGTRGSSSGGSGSRAAGRLAVRGYVARTMTMPKQPLFGSAPVSAASAAAASAALALADTRQRVQTPLNGRQRRPAATATAATPAVCMTKAMRCAAAAAAAALDDGQPAATATTHTKLDMKCVGRHFGGVAKPPHEPTATASSADILAPVMFSGGNNPLSNTAFRLNKLMGDSGLEALGAASRRERNTLMKNYNRETANAPTPMSARL